MSFPAKVPGLKGATAVYALYVFLWIALEGSLAGVIVMGLGTTAVLLAYAAQFLLADRDFSRRQWWGITAVGGLLFGLGSALLTLLFMAVKTGLHAHGPEFTPPEITWMLNQIPWWAAAGLLAGLAFGLFTSNNATK